MSAQFNTQETWTDFIDEVQEVYLKACRLADMEFPEQWDKVPELRDIFMETYNITFEIASGFVSAISKEMKVRPAPSVHDRQALYILQELVTYQEAAHLDMSICLQK